MPNCEAGFHDKFIPLTEAYEDCRKLILDDFEVVQEVEMYRKDWEPEPLKLSVILLAESYVHTTPEEFSRYLKKTIFIPTASVVDSFGLSIV